jgi:recombination protein RecA
MPPKKKPEAVEKKQEGQGFMALLGPNGKGLVKPASTGGHNMVLPSGILALDIASGRGGLYGGSITAITGDTNAGKSTTFYRTIANGQARGMKALIWNTESGRYSPSVAEANGMDLEEDRPFDERSVGIIEYSPYKDKDNPNSLEGNLQQVQAAVRYFFNDPQVMENGGIFVIDSINFMQAQEQTQGREEDDEESQSTGGIALMARLMSTWMPELLGYINRPKNFCLLSRQYRTAINKMGYGPSVSFSGGKALWYAASFEVTYDYIGKIAVPKGDPREEMYERLGNTTQIVVKKNTSNTYGMKTRFNMSVETGPDDLECVIRYGQAVGAVVKAGAYYKFATPDGTFTKSMYQVDAQEYYYETSQENYASLFWLMDKIRQAYIRMPKMKRLTSNDGTRNTVEEQGPGSEGEHVAVSQDTD